MQTKKFNFEPIIVTIAISCVSSLLEHTVFKNSIQASPLSFLYIYGIMSVVAGLYMYARGKEKDIDVYIWVIVAVLIPISVFTLIWAEPKELPQNTSNQDDQELLDYIEKLRSKN